MAYVVPIHRASSVRQAIRMKLLSPDEECLVVAKASRIEVWTWADDELVLTHTQRTYGTVSMLQALRPRDAGPELLFVGTELFDFFTAAWDAEARCLRTVDVFHDAGEKHMRDALSQDRCMADPSGRFLALLLWEGVVSVLRMRTRARSAARGTAGGGALEWVDQVRLSEMFVKASTFLHAETGHPTVAFLYQSQSDRRETRLSSYRLMCDDADTAVSRFDPGKDRLLDEDLGDVGAALLIPVEADGSERRHNVRGNMHTGDGRPHLGGLLVVGETRLVYFDTTTHDRIDKTPATPAVYVAWARYDGTHYFVADDQGTVRLLTLLTTGSVVTKLELHAIGKTARPSVLVYFADAQLLFVGSHTGDAQLWRIQLGGADGQFCTLAQTMANVGPILDFAVADMGTLDADADAANEYASGQARIVTGSGAYKDASLRSIRSGVGLADAGLLGAFGDVRALASLRLDAGTPPGQVDALLVSCPTETRVLAFDADGGVEELGDLLGQGLGEQTLLAASVDVGGRLHVLHATPTGLVLVDAASREAVGTWRPADGALITAASANDHWALLAVDGTRVVSLRIQDRLAVAADTVFADGDQVSAVHVAPAHPDVAVVALWSAGTVSVVDAATLRPGQPPVSYRTHDTATASVARSLALVQVLPPAVGGPTLFASLDDGSVAMFALDESSLALAAPRTTVLGVRHAHLHLLPAGTDTGTGKRLYSILATADHPSLVYGAEGRIVCAAVTAQDTTAACAFDAAAFPGAVVLAARDELRIAHVDTMRRTHVQTIPMGETVRRVAAAPIERVFALGCIQLNVVRGVEVPRSAVRLVDDVLFRPVGRALALDTDREEFLESLVCTTLPDAEGVPTERFLVGTSYLRSNDFPDDFERLRAAKDVPGGRLLVVGIDSTRSPYVVSAHHMRGPVRSLAVLDDDPARPVFVIGLAKTVIVAAYEAGAGGGAGTGARLTKLASARAASTIVDLAVQGRFIAVGDMMKSTAVLEYVPAVDARGGDASDDEARLLEARDKGAFRYTKPGATSTAPRSTRRDAQPAKLVRVAANLQANWVTALAALGGETGATESAEPDDDADVDRDRMDDVETTETTTETTTTKTLEPMSWLEADANGNLSMLTYDPPPPPVADAAAAAAAAANDAPVTASLAVTAEMNLGEMVNRIRHVDVRPANPAAAMVHPRAFLGTVEGSVYLFGTVPPQHLDLLLGLQEKLERVLVGLGSLSFSAYRGFRSADRVRPAPYRFVDGEMLERFLELDDAKQAAIAEGLGPSVDDLRLRVEELRRMH